MERPIIFSAPMVRAILDGRKTQTRRILKPQPDGNPMPIEEWSRRVASTCGESHPAEAAIAAHAAKLSVRLFPFYYEGSSGAACGYRCPFGKSGDWLWVRENWWKIPEPSLKQLRDGADTWPKIAYDADENDITREQNREMGWKLKPSIHMPRWASRIMLEVTSVRVERLQDISDDDAEAEGAEREYDEPYESWAHLEAQCGYFSPSSFASGFRRIWEAINGADSWEENPFVWVVSFKRVEN